MLFQNFPFHYYFFSHERVLEELSLLKMRWIAGVLGSFFKIFNPYALRAGSNSQYLIKFINFGFLGLVHNLSISLILDAILRKTRYNSSANIL